MAYRCRGKILIKCIDIAHWGSNHNMHNNIVYLMDSVIDGTDDSLKNMTPEQRAIEQNLAKQVKDGMRIRTEAMEQITLSFNEQDSKELLLKVMSKGIEFCMRTYGTMDDRIHATMLGLKAILDVGPEAVTMSFKLQDTQPVATYIQTSIEELDDAGVPIIANEQSR